jgi:hypothetical protein
VELYFNVENHVFGKQPDGGFQCAFRDFRICIKRLEPPAPSGGYWYAQLITQSGRHAFGCFGQPRAAAKAALEHWKDDIEESDRLDAEDSDRERRDYERDNKLRRDDVL